MVKDINNITHEESESIKEFNKNLENRDLSEKAEIEIKELEKELKLSAR
jgi:hypothetical protein